nr:MAG TPA: Protease NS2-3 C Virus, NS2 domain [Caudoviricetes sp.]
MESRISHFVMLSYFDGVLWNICFHLPTLTFHIYSPIL